MIDDQINKLSKLLARNICDNIEYDVKVENVTGTMLFKIVAHKKENADYIKGVEDTLEAFVKVLKVNQEPTPPSNRKN